MNNEPNTQIDEQRRLRKEFNALSPIQSQQLRWEQGYRDPETMAFAEGVVEQLGKKFNVNDLAEKHQIYFGYIHVCAVRRGFEPVEIAGHLTGDYIKSASGPLVEKIAQLKNQNSYLKQNDRMYADNFLDQAIKNQALEDKIEKLEKQLAKEKKKSNLGRK